MDGALHEISKRYHLTKTLLVFQPITGSSREPKTLGTYSNFALIIFLQVFYPDSV